jgi:hypothetical protein
VERSNNSSGGSGSHLCPMWENGMEAGLKRKLVLANNRTQFRDWLHENKFNPWDYYCAMTPEQLIGWHKPEIIKLPGWELHKAPEFFDYLKRIQL